MAHTQNGQAAYLALALHNLGEYRNHMVPGEAEDNLNNVFYTEDKLKFTFDRFVEIHISDHIDMPLVPNYVVPNPSTRVRKLLSSISSNNLTLLVSIASVQTSTTLIIYFEQTVDTLQSAIRATKITTSQKQRFFSLTGGRGGRGGHGGGGRGGGGNHYQGKRAHKVGRGGREVSREHGSSDKRV